MLKGFFTALSSKVFGSGQSEAESSNEGGGENSSSNALKEKSDQVSVDAAVVSTEAAVQKKENLKEASTDIVVPTPDENNKNNSGSEVTNKELSTSVFYTKSKNDPSGQETSHVTDKEQDQGKGEMTDTKSEDSPSPRSGGNGQDMSEWVTLEMPKGKRSPRNRKSRSPKNQDIKSTSDAVSAPSQDQKSLLDSDDVMIENASSPVEVTNSKLDNTEKGTEAGGDGRETLENNSGHLDEDSFSSMLVSSVLEEIVGQMSEVTVKDTMKDSKLPAEDTNQNANQDHADSVKPQDDYWRAKKPNVRGDEYCREKPQRGKKGMNRRGHKQGHNDDCPPADGEHGEGKEIIEEMKKLPPIEPNLEQEDFLQFCKMSTERDKLIRAKKLIYKLGYLKDVSQNEIKDVIRGQYKIAAQRSVHGWIEDARYFAEVMISRDWIDDNLLYLNPKLNKKSSNKRSKNRYMEKEDSFARKTGGLCQDVRLLTDPNLTVVRVNMKSNGHVETIKGGDEANGDRESAEVGSSGEKLARTEGGDLKTANDQDGKKEDGLEVGAGEAEAEKEDGEDQFEDCLEESVKDTDITEDEKKESGILEKSCDDNSCKALEEMEEPVEQGEVAEVTAQMEECMISLKEQDLKFDGDKDVQDKNSESKEDFDDKESEKQFRELVASNDSFTDPAIIMMVKSSNNSEYLPEQPSYGIEMPTYDPKCDVLSGLFRIEEDPRSLIETLMHSDSPTELSVTRDYPQALMMSQDDPTMVMENDSQLIDYLLTVTEEPKNPTVFPDISCNVENSSDSLAELEGIAEFLTDMVTSKICSEDIITDIDTAGIGDGGFGEEVVNLDLVKDESVMKLIEQCRTEDLAEGEACEGAGEAPALEGLVLDEGEAKECIQHFGDPVDSEMVYNLLQDLPILHPETSNASLKQDCIGGLSTDPDYQLTGDIAGDEFIEAVVGEVTKDPTIAISYQDTDHAQLEIEIVESQPDKEPYSPTQRCEESYSPVKNVNEPESSTKNLAEPITTSLDEKM